MKRALVVFAILLASHAIAQKQGAPRIAELKKELSAAKSPQHSIGLSLEISKQYLHYNLDSCQVFATRALELSRKQKLPALEARSQAALCFYFMERNDLPNAISRNRLSLAINRKSKNDKGIAYNYFLSGRINQIKADYVAATKFYFPSLQLAEKTKDHYTQLLVYKYLAFVFLDQQDYKKAHGYAEKADKMANRFNFPEEIGFTAGIIAEIYRSEKNVVQADNWFRKSYDYFDRNNNDYGRAWVLTNWSIIFEDDINKCLEMEYRAQKIWNRISPDNIMSLANLFNMGFSYVYLYDKDGKFTKELKKMGLIPAQAVDSAEAYFLKSRALAKKNNSIQWLMNSESALSVIYYADQDIEKYSVSINQFYKMQDSLYSQENKNEIAALESKQKMVAKDKEIQLNKLTLESKEKEKWFYILGIASLLVIGGLILKQSSNRKKTNDKLLELNTELDHANKTKARFFSILNHDLRSPVSNLIHFLHLQKESPELLDEESKNRMENKTISSAENLLESMEDILLWSKGQMENFKPQFKNVAVAMLFEDTQKHFSGLDMVGLAFENPENLTIHTDENYLKTIMRNLTGNAIKALAMTQNAAIVWKAFSENGQPFLSISDNGPGGTSEQFKALYDEKEVVGIKTGLGLHLIRDLAKAIHCKIEVVAKPGKGTTFKLTL